MAKTVIAPVIKSSNSLPYSNKVPINAYVIPGEIISVYAPYTTTSNILQCIASAGSQALVTSGLAWDNSVVPEGKVITNATLHFYTVKGEGKPVFYRYAEFNEGSKIPSYEPSDGIKAGGYSAGWGSLDLGIPKGNSIIIGQELKGKQISLYENGTFVGYIDVAECWQFNSHRASSNQPYVVITYEDVPPEPPKSLYPANELISTRNITRFAWLHDSKDNLSQKGFTLQYSTNNGSSWTTISQTTPNQYYDMPANTLPTTGTVLWRVKTKDTEDAESEYSTATFTLGIPPQRPPIPVAPISQYLEESKITRFEWIFLGGDSRETQSKFELQYSLNNGVSWITLTGTTSNNYREVPGNTFNAGNITWRVRTTNNWNEISPYSEIKAFTVIGSPSAPLITNVSNSAKPLIEWQANDQQTYELQIVKDNKIIFESGTMPTPDKRYKIPIFLANGNYIAKIRITNEYNFYSPWGEKSFTINVTGPERANIDVFNQEYCVTIKTDKPGMVYRDGKHIGDISSVFNDYTGQSGKEYSYMVRVATENSYTDSLISVGRCSFKGITIAREPSDFLPLIYGLDTNSRETKSLTVDGVLQNYDGRKYPIAEYSEFSNKTLQLQYFVRTCEELTKLEKMIESRKTLLYRSSKETIYGTVLSLNYTETTFGYELSLTFIKTGDDIE